MSNASKALIWASAIIFTALMMSGMGIESSASFAIIAGLIGAAVGSIRTKRGARGKACN